MFTFIKTWARVFAEDIKAWRRGEERIAPRPLMRGRVYRRKNDMATKIHGRPTDEHDASRTHRAAGNHKLTVSAKVIRKDGTVEPLGVISESTHTPEEAGKIQEQLTHG